MALIFINSSDSRFQTEDNNFEIELNSSDVFAFENSSLSVESIIFPNLALPVNQYCNTIIFQENNVNVNLTATIPNGYYSVTQFSTALKTALEVAGAGVFSCIISPTTNQLQISSTVVFKLVGGTALLRVCGFDPTASFALNATGASPVNLSGTNYVDIVIDNFVTKSTKSGRNIGDIFARIPVNKSYGNLIQWQNGTDDNIQVSSSFSSLKFTLWDEFTQPYLLPKNASFSIVLKVSSLLDGFN
jgi:hypothetical protein